MALSLLLTSCHTPTPEEGYILEPDSIQPRAPSLRLSGTDLAPLATKVQGMVLPVFGWSMYPCIPPWSNVVLEPFPFESLRLGDVVVYQSSYGNLVIHRLHRHSVGGYVAKGDNNHQVDSDLVTKHNYLGRVKVVELP